MDARSLLPAVVLALYLADAADLPEERRLDIHSAVHTVTTVAGLARQAGPVGYRDPSPLAYVTPPPAP